MKLNVVEVNESSFQVDVVERSHDVPVVVDFWAPWCGPCRMLTPILEQLAAEGEGEWILAKVNSDENPRLAQQYGVRGIPNVKAFRNGKVVDEFVGAQPKPAVQRFIQSLLPDKWDESVEQAEALIAEGKLARAYKLLEAVLEERPAHERAHLAMARVAIAEGDPDRALSHLDAIPARGPHGSAAETLRAQARFVDTSQESVESLTALVDKEPENLQARYRLSRVAAQRGDYDTAAQQLLHILERQRDFQDGAAHQAMLDLFTVMGEDDPRTRTYRQKLSWLLFA
ncbi:MAG: thioredoxin [Chloroflexota bacterium]|nr:thioredoxin [Chloroflexota bacterium]